MGLTPLSSQLTYFLKMCSWLFNECIKVKIVKGELAMSSSYSSAPPPKFSHFSTWNRHAPHCSGQKSRIHSTSLWPHIKSKKSLNLSPK